MIFATVISSLKREFRNLISRRIYFATMIVVPIASACFLLNLLGDGLPVKTPVAVVDLDNSTMSRQLTRTLSALQSVDVAYRYPNFNEAMNQLQEGNIYGFFLIPEDFEREATSNLAPTLSYFCNMSYYIPGTLSFKGFKTMAVSTSGSIVSAQLLGVGAEEDQVDAILQPIVIQEHPLNNPWSNYSIYLCNSFIPGIIALMVLLVTVFSVCSEIKHSTSPQWLHTAGNSIYIALLGKLLPHTLIFSIVAIMCQSLMYGYNHFPLNCNALTIISAMMLLVIACQSVGLIVCCIMPNLRLALSIVSLLGILSFSITGFSFPVESMYGAIGIFSYLIPVRHYFLIYIDQALNGIDIYYSRWQFVSLVIYPIIACFLVPLLKRRLSHPIYVP